MDMWDESSDSDAGPPPSPGDSDSDGGEWTDPGSAYDSDQTVWVDPDREQDVRPLDQAPTDWAPLLEGRTQFSVDDRLTFSDDAADLARALAENDTVRKLFMNNCRLRDAGAAAIFRALQDNHALQELHMAGNAVGTLDNLRTLGSLVKLTLNDNLIAAAGTSRLAELLLGNTTLQELWLAANRIDDAGVGDIASSLERTANSALHTLDVSDNALSEDAGHAIGRALSRNDSLRCLILSKNAVGDESAAALANALLHNTALVCLHLNVCDIGAEGAYLLAEALQQNSTLRVLLIKRNSIGGGEMALLIKAPHLTQLFMQSNPMDGVDGQREFVRNIADLRSSSLRKLHLGRCRIGGDCAVALMQTLQHAHSLEELHLDDNAMGPQGADAVAHFLRGNRSLRALFMASNAIGPQGASALAEALLANTALAELTLGNNEIGDYGAQALAMALAQASALSRLSVDKNGLSAASMRAFATALFQNTTLRCLDVSRNRIGDLGIAVLAKGLAGNTGLRDLVLDHTGVGSKSVVYLGRATLINSTLWTIHLNSNKGLGRPKANRSAAVIARMLAMPGSGLRKVCLRNSSMTLADMQCIRAGVEQSPSVEEVAMSVRGIHSAEMKEFQERMKYIAERSKAHRARAEVQRVVETMLDSHGLAYFPGPWNAVCEFAGYGDPIEPTRQPRFTNP